MNNFFTAVSVLLSISVLLLVFLRICRDRCVVFDGLRGELRAMLVLRGISLIAVKRRLPENREEQDVVHLFGLRLKELCDGLGVLRSRIDALPPPFYFQRSALALNVVQVAEQVRDTQFLFDQLRALVAEKEYTSAYMVSGSLDRLFLQLADRLPSGEFPGQKSSDVVHRLVTSWNVWAKPKRPPLF